jgi:hypothetical protein
MAAKRKSVQENNNKESSGKRTRREPGSRGSGNYYHVVVRPGDEFVTFRTQDVGRRGHIQRVAGKRSSGYWSTVEWLIGKEDAHVQDDKLIPDTKAAKDVIKQLSSEPVRLVGDRFKARPKRDVAESSKSTPAQQLARRENIKKAQSAQRKRDK